MKLIIVFLLVMCIVMSGCASSTNINGKNYEPYGLVNQERLKSDDVNYEISMGSAFVAIVLGETVIVSAYVVGWDLFEAKSLKNKKDVK